MMVICFGRDKLLEDAENGLHLATRTLQVTALDVVSPACSVYIKAQMLRRQEDRKTERQIKLQVLVDADAKMRSATMSRTCPFETISAAAVYI